MQGRRLTAYLAFTGNAYRFPLLLKLCPESLFVVNKEQTTRNRRKWDLHAAFLVIAWFQGSVLYLCLSKNPVLAFAPGLAIMMGVFAFNMVGDGLRDALDTRLRVTL